VLRPDGRVGIRRSEAGASPTTLKTSAALGIATGVWYRVRFELMGDALRLYVDGQLRVELQDSSLAKGTVALGGDNSAAAFDAYASPFPNRLCPEWWVAARRGQRAGGRGQRVTSCKRTRAEARE